MRGPTKRAKPLGHRLVLKTGYVLVKVGRDHHLAHTNGYAFEHRLVAEEKLGRRLLPGEVPHHINGIHGDNRPENIEVFASNAHHLIHHFRGPKSARRNPGEPNPAIGCACGCGGTLTAFDSAGKARRYIHGHNGRVTPAMRLAVLAALGDEPKAARDIARECGLGRQQVTNALQRLRGRGEARPVVGRLWMAATPTAEYAATEAVCAG